MTVVHDDNSMRSDRGSLEFTVKPEYADALIAHMAAESRSVILNAGMPLADESTPLEGMSEQG